MEEVKIQALTAEDFKKYGTFADMTSPNGPHLGSEPCEFYRDMGILHTGNSTDIGFSVTRVKKRPLIINEVEYHTFTGEAILPLDGDILIHVGAATGNGVMPFSDLEVFRIPKGTLVVMDSGVWHCGPFAIENEYINILVALPQRTYANDCTVVKIPKESWLKIVEPSSK